MGVHVSTLLGPLLVGQAEGGGGLLAMALPLVVMVAVMYFLMIRPERKKQDTHAQFLAGLKRGDEVVLTSGIIGKIERVEDRYLTVEIADKVKIKVLKVAVSGAAARYLSAGTDADKMPSPRTDSKDAKDTKEPEPKKA